MNTQWVPWETGRVKKDLIKRGSSNHLLKAGISKKVRGTEEYCSGKNEKIIKQRYKNPGMFKDLSNQGMLGMNYHVK